MAEGSGGAEIPIPVSAKETKIQKPTEANKPTDKFRNEPNPPTEQQSKRRRLLKGLAAAAALTGLAFWGNKEIKAGKEGIETPNATFIPLYERHDVGVAAKDIPNDLDILVREGGGSNEGLPGYAYLSAKSIMPLPGGGQKEISSYQEGVLEKLAQNGTKIAKADIDPGVTFEEARKIMSGPIIVGMATGLATMIHGRVKGFMDEYSGTTPNKKELSRRSFIKRLGYGTAAVLASGAPSGIVMGQLPAESGAVGRIITRLNAMQSHLHPEDLLVFIRNAFTADKMLTIAEQLKSEKNQKLKIGINYGSAHAGMEDFLAAGPEVCRAIISMFPKEYLQHVINSNGSAENLASAAIIEMPKDFKITDLQDRDKAMRIQVRKITDTKLSQQLQSLTK